MGSVFNRLVRIAVMELVQGLKHERKETETYLLSRACNFPYYLVQPRPQEATSPLTKDLIYLVGLTPEV